MKYNGHDIDLEAIRKYYLKLQLLGYCKRNDWVVYYNTHSIIVLNSSELFMFRVIDSDDGYKNLRVDSLNDTIFFLPFLGSALSSVKSSYIISKACNYIRFSLKELYNGVDKLRLEFKGKVRINDVLYKQYAAEDLFAFKVIMKKGSNGSKKFDFISVNSYSVFAKEDKGMGVPNCYIDISSVDFGLFDLKGLKGLKGFEYHDDYKVRR